MTRTIMEALADPHLFAGMFDAPSWTPWKVFLRALFALEMDEPQMAVYRHHTGRQEPPARASRYAELVVGRRGGKSRLLALVACFLACIPDHRAVIVPGEKLVIGIIAADRRQAQIILGYIGGLLRAVPLFAEMIEDELAESIRLSNDVTIEIHTAAIGAPRGRTFLAILADECAFWATGDSVNPDIEIINAVRPGLSTVPYSLLLIASSPYARRGLLYTNYARYFGKDDAPVLVWQGATTEMNTNLVDDPLIAEMYEQDVERASAEFGAQFRSDIVAFITREAVEDVLASGVRELLPAEGITYVGHVDPSGGSADSFTLAVAHLDPDAVAVLDLIREVKPPFSPDDVVAEYASILKSYGISRVTGDAYAGVWPRERFAVHGITYDVSAKNTSAIYGEFLPALNAKRVRLLDLPRLTGQLVGLERRTARGGRDSISHQPGMHDDVANVACGALVQIIEDRRPMLIRGDDLRAGDAQIAFPKNANSICAFLRVGADGNAAVVFMSRRNVVPPGEPQVLLLDFDASPLSSATFTAITARMEQLAGQIPVYQKSFGVFLPKEYMHKSALCKSGKIPIQVGTYPDFLFATATLATSAMFHISDGLVKITTPAADKAITHPLSGALSFKAGETVENDPLRFAVLLGIVMMLDNKDAWTGLVA